MTGGNAAVACTCFHVVLHCMSLFCHDGVMHGEGEMCREQHDVNNMVCLYAQNTGAPTSIISARKAIASADDGAGSAAVAVVLY